MTFNDFYKEQEKIERMDSKPIAEMETNVDMSGPQMEKVEIPEYDPSSRFTRRGNKKGILNK